MAESSQEDKRASSAHRSELFDELDDPIGDMLVDAVKSKNFELVDAEPTPTAPEPNPGRPRRRQHVARHVVGVRLTQEELELLELLDDQASRSETMRRALVAYARQVSEHPYLRPTRRERIDQLLEKLDRTC